MSEKTKIEFGMTLDVMLFLVDGDYEKINKMIRMMPRLEREWRKYSAYKWAAWYIGVNERSFKWFINWIDGK